MDGRGGHFGSLHRNSVSSHPPDVTSCRSVQASSAVLTPFTVGSLISRECHLRRAAREFIELVFSSSTPTVTTRRRSRFSSSRSRDSGDVWHEAERDVVVPQRPSRRRRDDLVVPPPRYRVASILSDDERTTVRRSRAQSRARRSPWMGEGTAVRRSRARHRVVSIVSDDETAIEEGPSPP